MDTYRWRKIIGRRWRWSASCGAVRPIILKQSPQTRRSTESTSATTKTWRSTHSLLSTISAICVPVSTWVPTIAVLSACGRGRRRIVLLSLPRSCSTTRRSTVSSPLRVATIILTATRSPWRCSASITIVVVTTIIATLLPRRSCTRRSTLPWL